MVVGTPNEVKEIIRKWLVDNEHSIKELKADDTTFQFEIDHPVGQQTKQIIVQPKKVPDLILVVTSVTVSPEHLSGLQKMKPKARESFLNELGKELIFKENQFEFKLNPNGILSNVVFTYPIYFDGLSKNKLYTALDRNFKSLFYLSVVLTEKVGGSPTAPSDLSRMYG